MRDTCGGRARRVPTAKVKRAVTVSAVSNLILSDYVRFSAFERQETPMGDDEDRMTVLSIDDFRDDLPWEDVEPAFQEFSVPNQIDGVVLRRLVTHSDNRGDLTVLLSRHYLPNETTPHVYMVRAAPGSVRAWVYHRRQFDRLAFLDGRFRVVLYDLRPDSPTSGVLNVLDLGAENSVQLTIPPFVAHGVQNNGENESFFVNMPTEAYDPANPDKSRLVAGSAKAPYHFR